MWVVGAQLWFSFEFLEANPSPTGWPPPLPSMWVCPWMPLIKNLLCGIILTAGYENKWRIILRDEYHDIQHSLFQYPKPAARVPAQFSLFGKITTHSTHPNEANKRLGCYTTQCAITSTCFSVLSGQIDCGFRWAIEGYWFYGNRFTICLGVLVPRFWASFAFFFFFWLGLLAIFCCLPPFWGV